MTEQNAREYWQPLGTHFWTLINRQGEPVARVSLLRGQWTSTQFGGAAPERTLGLFGTADEAKSAIEDSRNMVGPASVRAMLAAKAQGISREL